MNSVSKAGVADGLRNTAAALLVIGLVIGSEYFFRHYVLFWLPTIGNLAVNDMLALFLVYLLLTVGLGMLLHVNWKQEWTGIGRALREGAASWEFTGFLMALVFGTLLLSVADQLLWGNVRLPMVVSPYRNPAVWLAGAAFWLEVVSRLLVNGVFVPVAEEFLWRGVAQERLLRVFSAPVAIGLTAVLFSLKHALVDASLGRLLAIVAFGIVCGIVARRGNWNRSAALHIIVNTVATIATIVMGLV